MLKTLKISSSPEPLGRLPWNLVCSIWDCSTTKFVMMTLGWPWPILCQGQIWSLRLFNGKCGNFAFFCYCYGNVHFSVTVIVSDMEMQSILILTNAKGQGQLVTLVKGHFGWIVSESFFLETTRQNKNYIRDIYTCRCLSLNEPFKCIRIHFLMNDSWSCDVTSFSTFMRWWRQWSSLKFIMKCFALHGILAPPTVFISSWMLKNEDLILRTRRMTKVLLSRSHDQDGRQAHICWKP